MPRSDAQRRFDAMYAIFERAATVDPGAKAAIPLVNLVIDVPTLERYLAGTGDIAVPADPRQRRCETVAGIPVPPGDVVAAMIWGQVRRVVVDSAGVVINMGRRQRLFTRQRPPSDPVAIESVCGRRVCDTDPTLRSRPPDRMGPPRTHRRTQRCTGVWPPQPVEELRLPRPPRPTTASGTPTDPTAPKSPDRSRDHRDTPWSGSGV